MELGWIDFSKTERSKILSVLDLLGEKGVLDELGISPIRDAYSDLFFPGTTTIQTRAKYFFIVPYAFRDLEFNNQYTYDKLKKTLAETEKHCGHIFLENNPSEYGIIGRRSIRAGGWVSRPPSSIYWAGLKKYGFFKAGLSVDEYVKFIAFQKRNFSNLFNLGQYMCEKCGFEIEDCDLNYFIDEQTNCIVEHESGMLTFNMGDGSEVKGRVIVSFCRDCDCEVHFYYNENPSYIREIRSALKRDEKDFKEVLDEKYGYRIINNVLKGAIDSLNEDYGECPGCGCKIPLITGDVCVCPECDGELIAFMTALYD